jgi:Arylsulfotransferase (ASST)
MWSRRGTRAVALGVLVSAVGATSAVALTSGNAVTAQAGPVDAFPAPGTRAAQRGTEISLRGIAAGAVGPVTVTGSVSGAHPGTIQPHSDGRGASFVPAGVFQPGERVTVQTGLDVRGARDGDYRFTILRGEYETGRAGSDPAVPRPRKGTYHSYRSDPALRAPRLVVTRRRSGRAPGYLVLNTGWDDERPRPEGLLIADDRGRPVYFRQRTAERKIFDVAVQRYQGRPVITYWEGRFAAGWGYGDYVVLDESYREVLRVEAKAGYRADIHDMRITPENTLLVMSYNRVEQDLRSVGGRRNGAVLDNVIQEIDPATGRLLFEWHSLGTIGLRESRDRPERGEPFDYFHLNSMDVGPDGDILISARNTCAVYEIDRTTGAVNWRLGGRRSDFRLDRASRFCRQHDARWIGGGEISIFDNHVDRVRDGGQSRAIKLAVDERRKRVRLLRGYKHPRRLAAPNKGSARMQANGNMLVAWGAVPVITEFTRRGRIVLDARFAGATDGSYRALRADWVGRPATAPAVAAERRGGRVAVWASWNGATEVARWEVLGGASPDALAVVGGGPRNGFETALTVPGAHAYVAVRALDAGGAVLGTSRAVQP